MPATTGSIRLALGAALAVCLASGGAAAETSTAPRPPVAAGDVFNGCLAVALAEDKSLVEATAFANAVAAIAVTRHGGQASAPLRDQSFMFPSNRMGDRS